MKVKSVPARIKAAGEADGLGPNEFEAIVSVFNNIDAYGDVVFPGAFVDTLKAWEAKGDPLPVIWSHDWLDPTSHIGVVKAARELLPGDPKLPEPIKDLGGLWVHGTTDTAEENPKAGQIMRLMKGRRVTQFSFAYDVVKGGWVKHDGQEAYGLEQLDLFEIGPTLLGVNQSTELLAAKSVVLRAAAMFDGKSGARHSSADFGILQEIHSKLSALGVPCAEDDSKARQSSTGKAAGTDRAAEGTDAKPNLSPANVPLLLAELAAIEVAALD